MIREVVTIDEEKCDGCGLCVPSCAEGAIKIINGKAKLVADNLCDGLGACLGHCPQNAITVERREADEFDEVAVEEHLKAEVKPAPAHNHAHAPQAPHGGGCPSAQVQSLPKASPAAAGGCPGSRLMNFAKPSSNGAESSGQRPSELRQWPVQLHLVPPTAPFLQGADVLLTADCVPFAYADFHKDLLKDRALLIACPKLDNTAPYVDKLTAMILHSNINSLTVVHMEVPCCTGLIHIARQAVVASGKEVELNTIRIGIQGEIKN
ncbi:MAG: 4Fe-4S binding protein [Desulfuromonadaceae bacterium]|nr:4Fe-4S binding protein [Desulfuromonadaceae bacterium]